jgi:predicted CxxxxCH...CXXCH cytochrome family protein
MATDSHLKHINANIACGKCHVGTVSVSSDNAVTVFDNHINGARNVAFGGGVGGTYDGVNKTCSGTYCHGTPPTLPKWDNAATVTGCSICHQSQGAGTGTSSFTGVHQIHTDNTTDRRYRFACEQCHAWNASAHPNGVHAGGDDNVSGFRTVDLKFTDNAYANWIYDGGSLSYRSMNLWASPYGASAPSPAYGEGGSSAGTDSANASITWTAGVCGNVWCHSNANPAGSGGGANAYRTPAWTGTLGCTPCHLGPDTYANMSAASDRMSRGHWKHLGTDRYGFTCDECHANTVVADCTVKILEPEGYAYHVNAIKTDIKGSAGIRSTPLADNVYTYDAGAKTCSNTYCHSYGVDNNISGGFDNAVVTPAWGSGTTVCSSCHGGNAASGNPIATGSHTTHVSVHGYACGKCHAATMSDAADNAVTAYDNHVNGFRNVKFSPDVGGTYTPADKSCRNTYCHGDDPWDTTYEYIATHPVPRWGVPSSVPNCGVCHVDQGAGISGADYNMRHLELHHPHSSSAYASQPNYIRIACEVCHAQKSLNPVLHPNVNHGGGDDNVSSARTAEVRFTDNGTNQVYSAGTFLSKNMWTNPFTGAGATPTYAEGGYTAFDNDAHNKRISWTNGTCGTTWCHSNASPLGWKGVSGNNVYRGPKWSDSQSGPYGGACYYCHVDPMLYGDPRNMVLCGNCHRGPATAAVMAGADNLSGGHITHVATDRYNYTCDECHAWTAANDNNTKLVLGTGHDNHVDGVKTVRFSTTLRTTAVNQSGGTYNGGTYRCYNTYCHSNGTDNATFGAPVDNTISWNSATGSTCATCHGGNSASASPIATGSHSAHISLYKCSACHSLTVAAASDNVLNASTGYGNHVDGSKTVVQGDGYTFTYTPGSPYGSCADISCHGGMGATWAASGSLACTLCHLGTAGDRDDFGAAFWSNAVVSLVDNSQWTYSGHGKPSGTYDISQNPAAAFGGSNPCLYCHDDAVPHGSGASPANPFRLKDQTGVSGYGSVTPGWNATCLVCHSKTTTPPGYNYPGGPGTKVATSASRVDTAHYGSKHDNTSKGGRFCYDCHDPHGDRSGSGGNIFMVHDNVAVTTDNASGYGRPTSTAAVTFTDNSTGTSYAKSAAPYNGVCQVCHTTAAHYTQTSGDGHNSGSRCTICHHHDGNFESKCVDCHDNDGAKLVSAPLVVWSGGARPSPPPGTVQGGYGSHLVALKNEAAFSGSTNWNAQCNKCHTGHGGTVQVPMPPTSWTDPSGRLTGTNMAQRLGFDNYAVDNGVWLGGISTSGTTEADICWNCHVNASNAVSEWGPGDNNVALAGFPVVKFSTMHDGTPSVFDYGWIYTDNTTWATKATDWTNAYWRDEYSWGTDNGSANLKRRIVSVHSASFDSAGQSSSVAANVRTDNTVNYSAPTLENKSYLRCSYCHDVHDLNRARDPWNPAVTETKSGPPYLRGTFVSNPYPPDMPPMGTVGLGGNTYPTTGGPTQGSGAYGNRFRANTSGEIFPQATPRLFAFTYTTIDRGGFFIDNNSGNPTAGQSYQGTAGLCALCHATSVDAMDYYTGSTLWRASQTNGHSNSTLGGTGANAVEIFDARRGGTDRYMEMQDGINVNEWGKNVNYDSNDGGIGAFWNIFGSPQPCNSGAANCPPKNSGWYGGTPGSLTRGANYATWYGGTTPQKPAHGFSCSKCHMPHASGLPALLATNCLDIGMSNWKANSNRTGPNNGVGYGSRGPANCHWKIPGSQGWHRLAPKQTQ